MLHWSVRELGYLNNVFRPYFCPLSLLQFFLMKVSFQRIYHAVGIEASDKRDSLGQTKFWTLTGVLR